MKLSLKLNIIFLFVLVSGILHCRGAIAQTYDSTFYPTDSSAVLWFHNNLDTYSPLKLMPLDTTLIDFEAYNPLDTTHFFYASLGNVGLAYKNLDFTPLNIVGFDYGINSFSAYFFDQNSIKYYLNPKAYTEVGYVTGAKKEQLFNASHHQRVYKRLALGIDFSLINAFGIYQRQKSDNTKVAATAQFFSNDLRYGLVANYNSSKVKVRENGGILYDSIYEQNIETNRSIIDIHLSKVENILRKSGVYLQQYFQLSRKSKAQVHDSLAVPAKKFRLKFGRISHSFNYTKSSLVYTDALPNLDYYANTYIDSTQTYDSVFYKTIENTLSWSNADYIDRSKEQPVRLMFGVQHQVAEVSDSVLTTSYQNIIPYGELTISPHPFLTLYGKTSYVLSGDEFQGDYNIFALAKFEILRKKPYKTSFNFALDIANTAAPFFYRHYFSNHFAWDNGFSKVNTNKISAFIIKKNTKLGVDVTNLNDYLYVGADTLPAQFGQSIEVLKAYLYQRFVFGK